MTKKIWYTNGIIIGTDNGNPIFDTIIYEVDYQDGHKATMYANEFATNMFPQVYDNV